ncbi:MAG: type II toxin-antitoxin system VapC family toxin [Deltaproteobacteria bacterium]|nr:type II toxin-antitoxin system VapC family toxin [Deltaproteobacteria bacterium]MBW2154404.1 type II toxin-antitoxin system VapC family toxin [Deltaproteobacteria bacterium]
MKVSIDTCILLDFLLDQNPKSIAKLKNHLDARDDLIICALVYGELWPFFEKNNKDINLFLSEMKIKVEQFNLHDFAYAGKKWNDYCKRRSFLCPTCGKPIRVRCSYCRAGVNVRQHILSDFLIGAFSKLHCDGIITRDYGYYRTYFPELKQL